MTLQLIGGRDTFAAEAIPPTTGQVYCEWRSTAPAWATVASTYISLKPGRYRVESSNGFSLYYHSPWEAQVQRGADVLVQHETRPILLYAMPDKAGTFFITRLA